MSTELVVALVAGGFSLVSAAYANLIARRQEEHQRARTKAETVAELMARYRQPLLQASFDLQSRMYNVVRNDFLATYYDDERPDTTEYARESTLYVIAEYLGWAEILRHEVQFLDLGDQGENREWVQRLQAVKNALLTNAHDPVLQIMTGQQRAIGQVMMIEDRDGAGPTRHVCCGYAEFIVRRRDNQDFSRWFERLAADVDLLAEGHDGRIGRLVALQNALIELINFLDPACDRLPGSERGKLSKLPPAEFAGPAS